MKKQFIKLQGLRYRVSSIKRYEPFYREDVKHSRYGIYVYFSMIGNSNKVYHVFETEEARDLVLTCLDQTFGV
jgi:hypothetical protein